MKLSIVLGARARPKLLVETLARTLPNVSLSDTRILVALDDDDHDTIAAASAFAEDKRNVTLSVKPREDSLGAKFNRVLTEAKADVYLAMVDYAPHVTPAFDRLILEAADLFPDRIGVVYNGMANPSFPGINAVTHRWAILAGGFYPPYFPYWFIDHWLDDLAKMTDRLAFADVKIDVGPRPGTMELREPAWWGTFFDLLMPVRQEIARKIISKMDEPAWRKRMLRGRFPLTAYTSKWINECLRNAPWSIPNETNMGDARYQRIKARAIEVARTIVAQKQAA